MKNVCLLAAALCLVGWFAPSTALAAKADGPKAKFFAKYDKNHNGVIDDDEKDAIRKDYAANPEGDLKRFDKNKDGKLDDEEIAAIKPPTGKKKGEQKSAKKADAAASPDKASDNTAKTDTGAKPAEKTDPGAQKDK